MGAGPPAGAAVEIYFFSSYSQMSADGPLWCAGPPGGMGIKEGAGPPGGMGIKEGAGPPGGMGINEGAEAGGGQ